MSSYQEFKNIDFSHLWHPFTQQKLWFEFADPLIIERGEGVELIDLLGNRYLDGVSSIWCNVHGHTHPRIVAALKDQLDKLCHSTLLGLSHQPALELTRRLCSILPKELNRIFYADSGTTAVEAALRMALEWWQREGSKRKTKLASLIGGYHGDSLGAIGVGYVESFHKDLEHAVVKALQVAPPHLYRSGSVQTVGKEQALSESIQALAKLFDREGETIAAFIFEPLVQGAAGIWIQPVEFLKEVAALCRKYNILLIADEVATGFGKTGKMFAIEHGPITPDFLVMGKGLSGGLLPISAVAVGESIFSRFLGQGEEGNAFFYGQTFAGNPLAARAASENLDLFSAANFFQDLSIRIAHFHQELDRYISPLTHVEEIRRFGVMVGIELTATKGKHDPYPLTDLAGLRVVKEARELGVLIRPIGNTMILMPALCMSPAELTRLVMVTAEAIQRALGE